MSRRPFMGFKLYPHQEEAIAFVQRAFEGDLDQAYMEAAQAQQRRATIKNGFVGPLPRVYGVRVMPMVLSLKSTEWRRL